MELTCPITLQLINEAGITCVGSIYEYNVIKKWLENHTSDPLTNLPLYTLFVVKFSVDNVDALKDKANDIRHNTQLVDNSFSLQTRSGLSYNILSETVINKDETWNNYQNHFISSLQQKEIQNIITRPTNTGESFQFMNLTGCFNHKNFKNHKFDFAILENCIFVSCNFSRTTFIGTTFHNVVFTDCKFVGEEITFYKANCVRAMFVQCEMEYVNKWITSKNPQEVTQILTSRFLEGRFNVI